jgi:hypothetical protein
MPVKPLPSIAERKSEIPRISKKEKRINHIRKEFNIRRKQLGLRKLKTRIEYYESSDDEEEED